MMRVGYVPYSKDLKHPADRRRLSTWARERQIQLNIKNPLDSDVLILSNAANFGYWFKRAKQPIIIDLVDGYIGENPSFIRDFLRNIIRAFRGTSSLHWVTYTRHLRQACKMSSAVVVASTEQRDWILPLNANVHVILDDHSEIDFAIFNTALAQENAHQLTTKNYLFWEGFGYTLKHFRFIAPELDRFLTKHNWGMYVVTVEEFPRWGGYLGKVQTHNLLKEFFPLSWKSIEIVPWSIQNLVSYALRSKLGIIPIDDRDKFAVMKSENKLLSMWHLNLPVFFSNIPSYSRVAHDANVNTACVESPAWFEKLSDVLDHPIELAHLQASGSKYIKETHTKAILVGKWDEVINQAIRFSDVHL
jgi:hypothetical protein